MTDLELEQRLAGMEVLLTNILTELDRSRPEVESSSRPADRGLSPSLETLAAAIAAGDRTLLHSHNRHRRKLNQPEPRG